jgi:pimeloyl-ACP methyl ester carboxylesterase
MLHYTTYLLSESSPWVTFIHGAGGSSSIWFRQIKDFKKSFNVLLVDLRGHGRSKKIDYENLKRYTFDKIGDDVMEVLDYLQIKKTHFVGISLGTIIIREITERFPNRTVSMVLGGAVMKLNVRGQILMRLGALLQSIVPYLLLYKLLAFVIMPRKKHKESRNLFINEAKKLYQREFKRWFTLVSEVNPLLNLFRIKDSGVPTLYIMGEEDYMFLPSIKQLVKNHISSELFVIPACGHVVNVEKPDEFNRQALYFLQNHSSDLNN